MTLIERLNFDMRVASFGRKYPHAIEATQLAAMESLIRTQWEANALQAQSNRIAVANHLQLRNIDDSLAAILDGQNRTAAELAGTNARLDTTNRLLQDQSAILSDMRQTQDDHLTLVKRERALKEVLFNVDKCLATARTSDDRIAAGYTAEVLLSVIDDHRFGTQDLGDLSDKRVCDDLISNAKSIFRNLTPEESKELQHFRSLYSAYHARRAEGPAPPPDLVEAPQEPISPATKPTPPVLKSLETVPDKPSMTLSEAQVIVGEKYGVSHEMLLAKEAIMADDSSAEGCGCLSAAFGVLVLLGCISWLVRGITGESLPEGLIPLVVILPVVAGIGWGIFLHSAKNAAVAALGIDWSRVRTQFGEAEQNAVKSTLEKFEKFESKPSYTLGSRSSKIVKRVRQSAKTKYAEEMSSILNDNPEAMAEVAALRASPRQKLKKEQAEAVQRYKQQVEEWNDYVKRRGEWKRLIAEHKVAATKVEDVRTTNGKVYVETLQTMRRMVNDYLEAHQGLQEFFAKI